MPGVCREKDSTTTGHLCDIITKVTGSSGNVKCNGKGVERKGDPTITHEILQGIVCVPHLSNIKSGSSSVFVNGKAIARITDACDLGAITGGSGNVFAGG